MIDYHKLAKQIVKSTRIGRKDNPGIEKARKKFGEKFINKLIAKGSFSLKQFNKKEQSMIKKLKGFRYGPLVYEVNGKYKVKTKIGELIRLVYSETDERSVKLARIIKKECWKLGCHVSFIPHRDADSRTYFKTVPEDSLVEMPKVSEMLAKSIDLRLFVGDEDDLFWSKGLEKRLKLSSPSSQRLFYIQDKRKVRWCLVGFPVKMKKDCYVLSRKKYEKIYIDAIFETFSKRTLEYCNYYKKKLKNGDKIRIVADDGSDLKFSIKNRPILVADGIIDDNDMKMGDIGLNIPDGEVFLAPLEYSANGKILFDFVSIRGFGLIENIWLTFKNGKVVDIKGDKKSVSLFKKFLDSNTGQKDRIAELGIGCNTAAEFIGTTIVDEKIFGTIHIAIGNNTGAYHGKNKASSHQDMIKFMEGKNGKMYIDDKLIMKNGKPVK